MKLWDQLISEGEDGLRQLIGSEEEFRLEFKSKTDSDKLGLTKDDKQNLGKCLSAFANSDGGIVIWGIATAKTSDGIDRANELDPIFNIENFCNQVSLALETLVSPVQTGIQLQIVKTDGDDNRGYLIMEVPESNDKPVMSMAANHTRYYLKTLQGTVPMHDRLVRQAVLANQSAVLSVKLTTNYDGLITQHDRNSKYAQIRLLTKVTITNGSRVSAEAPYVRILGKFSGCFRPEHSFKPAIKEESGGTAFHGTVGLYLHPGQSLTVASFPYFGLVPLEQLLHLHRFHTIEDYSVANSGYPFDGWRFAGQFAGDDLQSLTPCDDQVHDLRFGAVNSPLENELACVHKFELVKACRDIPSDEIGQLAGSRR